MPGGVSLPASTLFAESHHTSVVVCRMCDENPRKKCGRGKRNVSTTEVTRRKTFSGTHGDDQDVYHSLRVSESKYGSTPDSRRAQRLVASEASATFSLTDLTHARHKRIRVELISLSSCMSASRILASETDTDLWKEATDERDELFDKAHDVRGHCLQLLAHRLGRELKTVINNDGDDSDTAFLCFEQLAHHA